eukprot:7797249-Pyramimonas_sp.AAC.1
MLGFWGHVVAGLQECRDGRSLLELFRLLRPTQKDPSQKDRKSPSLPRAVLGTPRGHGGALRRPAAS